MNLLERFRAFFRPPEPTASEPTISELLDLYEHHWSQLRTWKKSGRYYIRWTRNWFGAYRVSELRPGHLREHVSQRVKMGIKLKSISREIGIVRTLYRLAIDDGLLSYNPAAAVKFSAKSAVRTRYLLDSEEPLLRKHCRAKHWRWIQVAIWTGMRLSEQFGLRRENINWEGKTIHLELTKNGSARYVPMSDRCAEVLREQLATHNEEHVFPSPQRKGMAMDTSTICRIMQRITADAGLEGLTWHCLRHTAATRMLRAGVDIRSVAEILGHGDINQTMRYVKVCSTATAAAVEKLSAWSDRIKEEEQAQRQKKPRER